MTKRIVIPIVIALIAVLLIAGVAYAAGNKPMKLSTPKENKVRNGLGQITTISDDQFTIKTLKGAEFLLQVDEKTRFFKTDGSEATFTDLKVDQWAIGRAIRNDGQIFARLVILLPEGFDPSQIDQLTRGEVSAVGDDSFTLNTPSGENPSVSSEQALTFSVNAQTTYLGEIHSLADLQAGMGAIVGAKKLEDGSLLAITVGARTKLIRHGGKITSVDPAAGTFGLQTRQGENLTFSVDANTKYIGKGGAEQSSSIQSLADLKPEMLALVAAKQLEDGKYLAVKVAARERPTFDLKVGGQITAVNETSFSIKTRDGQSYTFQVNDETRFLSKRGAVEGIEALKLNIKVGIGAQDLGNGQYVAQVVLVKTPKP